MNDINTARLYVAVVGEQARLFWIWLLIRLKLKRVTIEERYDLVMRRERIRMLAGSLK